MKQTPTSRQIEIDQSAPLLVFGGPYSNLQATTALKAVAEELQIPTTNIICTGDCVAYCANPNETIALIRSWGIHVIQGNCEEQLAAGKDDCGCGFEEGSACDALSAQWYAYTNKVLNDDLRRWMASLPQTLFFTYAGKRYAVIHGGTENISQFIFASTEDAQKRAIFEALDVDCVLAGHSGIPFSQQIGNRHWINAGVIGMPANDGTPDVWYTLIGPEQTKTNIQIRRLPYDHASAARAMELNNLPRGYSNALLSGLWPSLDVLPKQERNATGLAIDETTSVIAGVQQHQNA